MKRRVVEILVVILCLSVVLCGCAKQPAGSTDTGAAKEETEYLKYPGNTGIDFPEYGELVPEIIFTTTGEENGLIGKLYMVIGSVKEHFYTESGAGYLRVSTVYGDIVIADAVDMYRCSDDAEIKSLIDFNVMRDYCPLPREGEFCTIFAEYQGMSNTFDCPFFIYASEDYLTEALMLSFREESVSAGGSDPNNSDTTTPTESKPTETKPKDTTQPTTQPTQPTTKPTQPTTEPVQEPQTGPTAGEKNALTEAKQYLKYSAFSYSGLVAQLEYEGYSKSEAKYGADNCGADWNEQAVKMAKQYVEFMPFSRSQLISQLKYEGFTQKQAEHGADSVGL